MLSQLTPLLLASVVPWANALYENGSVIAPCDSPLYCQGEILREIELAQPFADSKLYVDLPTIRPLEEVIAAFEELEKPLSNNTALNEFLTTYFGEAGSELGGIPTDQLETDPTFLEDVNSTDVRSFISQVIDIWPDLTREYVGSGNCSGCVSSFLPLNRTFVVAGGRFREPYYWDSYWIVLGLLRTKGSFTQIAENIILNFLDFVDEFGFVPNGARRYYLNRSQPPVLTQMVDAYVQYTGDDSILERALPTLAKEHEFWMTNRTVYVEVDGEQYTLNHYAVQNTQPRPESYREDYVTATNSSYYAESGIIYPATSQLNETELAQLYANLASGAESGWDYTSRWLKTPNDAINDVYFPLRSLNVIETVPVDLNSLLYFSEATLARLYNTSGNTSAADEWATLASERSKAMTAVLWSEEHWRYFDYNLTSSSLNTLVPADDSSTAAETSNTPPGTQIILSPSQFYPFWTGAAPTYLKNNPASVARTFEPIAAQLANNSGAIPATNLFTGQQWDEPNVWPPLQQILIQALLNTPPTFGQDDPSYIHTQNLALNLSQRYLDSTFCTWRSTGGETPNFPALEGLNEAEMESGGTMFEKYADNSTNAAGGGGEYEVVEGFGWSNGVLIWIGDLFGQELRTPDCGEIEAADTVDGGGMRRRAVARRAVEVDRYDARWIRKSGGKKGR